MTIEIELKHGRLALTKSQAEWLGFSIKEMGACEIRIAGRRIIFDPSEPLQLVTPPPIKPKKGKKRARPRRPVRNTTKRR